MTQNKPRRRWSRQQSICLLIKLCFIWESVCNVYTLLYFIDEKSRKNLEDQAINLVTDESLFLATSRSRFGSISGQSFSQNSMHSLFYLLFLNDVSSINYTVLILIVLALCSKIPCHIKIFRVEFFFEFLEYVLGSPEQNL